MKGNNIKQKIIHCGRYGEKAPYIEVDIYSHVDTIKKPKGKRIYVSEPKQKNLNEKRAKRYFNQLVKSNFTNEDLRVDLTYSSKHLPSSIEEAEKEVANFIRRLKTARNKAGLPPLKYIVVTEQGKKKGRIHHHMLINGGLDRDTVENLWRAKRKKGEKEGEKIGICNADRLQFNNKGVEGLTNYLLKDQSKDKAAEGQVTLDDLLEKDPEGRKRWKQSNNLVKPWYRKPSTKAYTKRAIEKLVKMPPDSEEVKFFFERRYRDYELDECRYEFNEYTATWGIYLKMHLIT